MAARKSVKKSKSVKKAAARKPAARTARRPGTTTKPKNSTQVAAAKVSKPAIAVKVADRAAAVESIMGESQSLHEFLSSSGW